MPDSSTGHARRSVAARILGALEMAVETVALIAFVVMMVVTLLQVLTRYVLHVPMPWTEELARTLFIGAMMIGIALAVRRDEHIVVDFLLVKLSPRNQALLQIIFGIAILGFLAVWLRGAMRLAVVNVGSSYVTLPWMRVSDIYRIEAAAVGLMMLFVVLKMARHARVLRGARAPGEPGRGS